MSIITDAVTKIKTWAMTNIKKILLFSLIVSLCLNVVLLISSLNISMQQNQQTTNNVNTSTKVDTWNVNQNQNVNVNILGDYYKNGKLNVIVTNLKASQLAGYMAMLDPYSFMYKAIIYVDKDNYMLVYPFVNTMSVITKTSATNQLTNYTTSIQTQNTKLGTIWKLR